MGISGRNLFLMALMLATSGLAMALRPTHKISDHGQRVKLEAMIPLAFDDWHEESNAGALIIDAQQQATIKKIYSETLSRTYVNSRGNRIMLSIAYGQDQSDSNQLHKPEVCYPAQGFSLLEMQRGVLTADNRSIPVTRIVAQQGQRVEPVTYWTTIGDLVVQGTVQKKMAEMRYGFAGEIPDGLLFRVSSIDSDKTRAFELQEKFVKDILVAIAPGDRVRIAGKAH